MKNKKYIDIYEKINFSSDESINNKILTAINKYDEQKNNRIYIAKVATAILCVLTVTIFTIHINNSNNVERNLMSRNSITKINKELKITKIKKVTNENNEIDNVKIQSHEMLVIKIKKNNKGIKISGYVNKNSKFELGFIKKCEYISISRRENTNIINENIFDKDIEYLCISNITDKEINISGKIMEIKDDLVYRTFGDDAIEANEMTVLIYDNALKESLFKKIYAYNCQTENSYLIGVATNSFNYNVKEAGSYYIYGVREDDSYVELNRYIKIETEIREK